MGQQTAVEFLIEQLIHLAFNPDHHLGMGDVRVTQGMLEDWSRKAKEIEKMQMEIMYNCGRNFQLTEEGTFTQVYNKAYKNQQDEQLSND